jgi:hypothetical protein
MLSADEATSEPGGIYVSPACSLAALAAVTSLASRPGMGRPVRPGMGRLARAAQGRPGGRTAQGQAVTRIRTVSPSPTGVGSPACGSPSSAAASTSSSVVASVSVAISC